MRIVRIFLILTLFAGVGRAWAQMTDDQIIEYVSQAMGSGKSEAQIGRELLARGVRMGQLRQIKARLMSDMNQASAAFASSSAAESAALSASRTRDDAAVADAVGLPGMGMYAADPFISGMIYGESLLPDPETLENYKPIYGHNIFNSPALSFEPNENISTPENYKLGPGDEVIIDIWGANEASLRSTISPEGDIMVSHIGPVYLAGLTVKEAGDKIRGIFARKYEGVSGDEPLSDIRVTLGHLRTMRINVMGEVAVPGTYRLSGFSSLFHALYNAGGITSIGSLRDIKIIRGDCKAASADIYEYLFDGKLSTDVRLQEDDVIIVPAYAVQVLVEGEFKRPMYYEMKPGETLADLIRYAGGFTGKAFVDELKIVRGTDRRRTILTVPADKFASTQLVDGDVVTAGAILERFDNRAEISGAVYREGAYEIGDRISTIRELVAAADGVKDDAFLQRVILTRKKNDATLETISVDLEAILNGTAADVVLHPDDSLHIPSIDDVFDRGNFTINGLVANPGTYPYAENTTIEDLILKAGGLLDGASTVKIEVARRKKNPRSTTESSSLVDIFLFDIEDGYVIDNGASAFYLEPFDVVQIRRSPGYQEQRNVRIDGEVVFAGSYSLTQKNERLSDLVLRAGGVTSDAYVHGARLIRKMNADELAIRDATLEMAQRSVGRDSVSVASLNLSDTYTVGIELDKALEKPGSYYDMVLREGDMLVIPERVSTVRINGAVMYPNTVLYQKGQKLKEYISQAGGYGSRARKCKAYIVYMNGTVAKVKRSKGASMIEPGCEIVIPSKPERDGVKLAEILAVSTTAASLGTMAASIANLARRW